MTAAQEWGPFELRVPAQSSSIGVVRSLAATVATRLDLDLDHIEDVRLAVSEACSLLVPQASEDAQLTLVLTADAYTLTATLSVPTASPTVLAPESFAWTVLHALTDSARSTSEGGRTTVRLTFTRAEEVAGADPG
jgi:serine/threonine-protein kinase RsbW